MRSFKMRKNLIMRFAYVTLAMTVLLMALVGSTYARFTTVIAGRDTARVAIFHVDAPGLSDSMLDLFKTSYRGEGAFANQDTVGDDSAVVAPGTTNTFDIQILYTAEVDSTYVIKITEHQNPVDAGIPIVYSLDNGATWFDAENSTEKLIGELKAGNHDVITTLTWRWDYEDTSDNLHDQTDGKDTDLGFDGTASITLGLTLTVTQID